MLLQALTGLIRTMRPTQWTKNVLFVFPAIIFDGKLFYTEALINVVYACFAMILMSGTVYIINDLVDIEKDRQHPRKKDRPLPSGQLPKNVAIIAAIVIPLVTLVVTWFIHPIWGWKLAVVLLVYLLIQILYSFVLKNIVLLDVLTVTAGFVLRVVAGVVVIDVENFSPWLYACTGLLALFLVVGKRRQELVTLGENAVKTRPIFQHYNLALLDDMLRMVTTSTLITYLLYTIERDTVIRVAGVNLTPITVMYVVYGLFRYLYLIHVRGEGSAPDEVLLKDRPLQIAILLFGLTFIALLYVLPRLVQA
jgi:4-hydroxybenzoate polyprenyltransferase